MTLPPLPRRSLSRRLFLTLLAGGGGTVLCAQTTAILVPFLRPLPPAPEAGRVYAGRLTDFVVGSVTRVLAGRCFVVRLDAGLLALSQRCTHLGCAVPWQAAEGRFHCPCHGSTFNTVGEVTGGPAPRPLDWLPITLDADAVWVSPTQPQQRAAFAPEQVTEL